MSYVPCGVFKPCTEIEGRNDVEEQRFAYDCPICSSSEYQYWLVWKVVIIFGGLFSYSRGCTISGHSVLFVILLPIDIVAFVYLVYQTIGKKKIKQGISQIAHGEIDYKIDTTGLSGEQKEVAELVNVIGTGLNKAVEKSVKNERLKTDLITNVSHDIKTPLTSIINYVELLKQENFEDPKIRRYIEVLEQKSQRLKTLTEDVVEALKSKFPEIFHWI